MRRGSYKERPHPRTQFSAQFLVREWVEVPLKSSNFDAAMTEARALTRDQVNELSDGINDHSTELISVGNRMFSKVDD